MLHKVFATIGAYAGYAAFLGLIVFTFCFMAYASLKELAYMRGDLFLSACTIVMILMFLGSAIFCVFHCLELEIKRIQETKSTHKKSNYQKPCNVGLWLIVAFCLLSFISGLVFALTHKAAKRQDSTSPSASLCHTPYVALETWYMHSETYTCISRDALSRICLLPSQDMGYIDLSHCVNTGKRITQADRTASHYADQCEAVLSACYHPCYAQSHYPIPCS